MRVCLALSYFRPNEAGESALAGSPQMRNRAAGAAHPTRRSPRPLCRQPGPMPAKHGFGSFLQDCPPAPQRRGEHIRAVPSRHSSRLAPSSTVRLRRASNLQFHLRRSWCAARQSRPGEGGPSGSLRNTGCKKVTTEVFRIGTAPSNQQRTGPGRRKRRLGESVSSTSIRQE
jgi:hypothetical protein